VIGRQRQVVWPNGVLASWAIGQAVRLLPGWSEASRPAYHLDYRGSQLTISESNIADVLQNRLLANDLEDNESVD
jgi:hypothetical protein